MQVFAKKHLGQHFLTDPGIASRIVSSLQWKGVTESEAVMHDVLEIGPGKGVLTKFLFAKPDINTLAVDIDAESVRYLHLEYPEKTDSVILADFLNFDVRSLFTGTFSVIGNFPYNISSQILFRVLDMRGQVDQLVGMFQKEVAQRVCATPRTKEYGILSVLIQAFYQTNYLFTVNAGSFFPPPKVKSGVLRLERREDFKLDCDESLFFRMVKMAFNQRRKTLRNALSGMLNASLQTSGFQFSDCRAEELGVSEFTLLCRIFSEAGIK